MTTTDHRINALEWKLDSTFNNACVAIGKALDELDSVDSHTPSNCTAEEHLQKAVDILSELFSNLRLSAIKYAHERKVNCEVAGKRNVKNLIMFSHGMFAAFDESGKQIPELQSQSAIQLWCKFAAAQGFNPEGCVVKMQAPGGPGMELTIQSDEQQSSSDLQSSSSHCHAFLELDGSIDVDSIADTACAVKEKMLEGSMGWRFEHPERYSRDEEWARLLKLGSVVPVLVSVESA